MTYPGGLHSFIDPSGKAADALADDHVDAHVELAEELAAVQAELGVNPSGAAATVAARIAAAEAIDVDQAVEDYFTANPPAGMSDASTTVKGVVELATDAETVAGTDTVRAVTPAGVAAAIAEVEVGGTPSPYFDAEDYTDGNTDLEAIHAACAAATAAGNGSVVRLSARTWDVGNGLSLSGYSCGLVGLAAGHDGTHASGTVLHASTQTGPVLNLTGWVYPSSFRGRVDIGGFALRGSGVADATKVRSGLFLAEATANAISGTFIRDIAISETGGPCVDMGPLYLCDMARVTAVTPVSAKANDVPYMVFRSPNGSRFQSLGFRSTSTSADTGASGALIVTDDGTYPADGNVWTGTWFENLHVPTNGTLLSNAGNAQAWRDTYFVDCSKESGATGTAFARFLPSDVTNFGGNEWSGMIPGRDNDAAFSIDAGIVVTQSRNFFIGAKGYKGTNVVLGSGVGHCVVELAGSQSAATEAGVVDSSGEATNVYVDHNALTETRGAWRSDVYATGGFAGPRIMAASDPTRGTVWLGNGDVRFYGNATEAFHSGENVYFKDQDEVNQFELHVRYSPGWKYPNHGSLPAAASGLRGKTVFVHGGAGVADEMYVCRKTSSDTYEWRLLS